MGLSLPFRNQPHSEVRAGGAPNGLCPTGPGGLGYALESNPIPNEGRSAMPGLLSTLTYHPATCLESGGEVDPKASTVCDVPPGREAERAIPLQVKHLMWKCLVWTRSTSPLHGSPHLWQ